MTGTNAALARKIREHAARKLSPPVEVLPPARPRPVPVPVEHIRPEDRPSAARVWIGGEPSERVLTALSYGWQVEAEREATQPYSPFRSAFDAAWGKPR